MVKLCIIGDENEIKFRTACNELLQEIWRNGGCYSGYDWKSEFNAALSREYGLYRTQYMGEPYPIGAFKHISDVTMEMCRKVLKELNI